ncbi:MAG: HYR domain-containing protein [SAR202 cluster bacterium]|nr:HYR domain-containing protein [SAR202 cluster bacterium]
MSRRLKLLTSIVFILLLAAIPALVAADQQLVDNDLASPGNQNIVNVSAPQGAAVNTSGRIVVNLQGSKHLVPGSSVTFVDADGGQTTIPAPYSVSNVALNVPANWGSGSNQFSGVSNISFTAPMTVGLHSYTVKWRASSSSCQPDNRGRPVSDCLTGAPALVINLTVLDITPPVLDLPADVVVEATGPAGAAVSYSVTASDNADPSPVVDCNPPSGSVFPLGDTTVDCTATDASGNSSNGSFTLHVVDTTPPTVTLTPDRGPDHNGWYNHSVHFTVSSVDLVGVASCDPDFDYTGPDGSAASVSASCTDTSGNVGSVSYGFMYDATAPTGVSGVASRAPNHNGWYNHSVGISFTGSDATSGIDSCSSTTYSGPDGSPASVPGSCTDKAGNTANSFFHIFYDVTPPVITISGVSNGATYTLGAVPTASYTCTDATSGVATSSASTSGGNANGVGAFTYSVGCSDKAGNSASKAVSYSVVYAFSGFLQPISAPVQTFKAGSTIPVKFKLTNAAGISIGTAVASVSVNGGPSLGAARYDASAGQYIFNLSTKGIAAGSLTITITLDDGTTRSVTVTLKP